MIALKLRDEDFYKRIIGGECNATEIIDRLTKTHNAWEIFGIDPATKRYVRGHGHALCAELYAISPRSWREGVIVALRESKDKTFSTVRNVVSCRSARSFVFVDDEPPKLYKAIAPYMTNRYTLSVEDADFLDAAFADSDCATHLSVDRTKLEESAEAWVYVKIDPDVENWSYTGFNAGAGILTWDNSD